MRPRFERPRSVVVSFTTHATWGIMSPVELVPVHFEGEPVVLMTDPDVPSKGVQITSKIDAEVFVCPHSPATTCASSAVNAAAALPVEGRTCITFTALCVNALAFQISAQRTTFEMTGRGAMSQS